MTSRLALGRSGSRNVLIWAALAAVAAMAVPMAASAQDFDENLIIVGAITDPSAPPAAANPRDAAVPELPVVADDQAAAAPAEPAQPAPARSDATAAKPQSVAAAGPDLGHRLDLQ